MPRFEIINLTFVKPFLLVTLCEKFIQKNSKKSFWSPLVIPCNKNCFYEGFRKYPDFSANLVWKFRIVSLNWNLVLKLFRTHSIWWWRSFFPNVNGKYCFWAFLVQKLKLPKLRFGVESYSNMRNSMVLLTFCFRLEFWANLVQKNQNYLYQLKFVTEYNSSMLILMVMFAFSSLDRKHTLWANLVQKFKFVCLWCNLVHRLN